ncbi:hypothetical protein HYDPIDRAFT_104381 [Hydnomerulius pinastri MD-312]|nr:hypothetical protein HYDPIDRAFT_104381 [Hydnomerulius pinastri MD-312]
MPVLNKPIISDNFNLDASGVVGFFGGEEVIAAIGTVHLYKGKRWLGWYNLPGSYTIARRFGQLANSGFWHHLFPGSNGSPESSLGLDGKPGPKYVGALSGTVLEQTGYLGNLMTTGIKAAEVVKIPGRVTLPNEVALLDLRNADIWCTNSPVLQEDVGHALLALIPIITSLATCIICGLCGDWYCFAMILLGIVASGVTSFVIGSAELSIQTVRPASGSPPGDGMLIDTNSLVVLKGEEGVVNAITKGKFVLKLEGSPSYNRVGLCSMLLVIQFLLQLLLIPQGSLFGQVMFITSLAVSWLYCYYLSTIPQEDIQLKWLLRYLGNPKIQRFRLGTRTTMSVFACLMLCDGLPRPLRVVDPEKTLRDFIPLESAVWQRWRKKVIRQLNAEKYGSLSELDLDDDDVEGFEEADTALLNALLGDAKSAFAGYLSWRDSQS